jgi:3-oxoadipate enol-lactonase
MPIINTGEIAINYQETGEGFPLILLHGLSDDLNLWNPLLPELSKKYRTIAIDLRGHGHSAKPEAPYSIHQFSGDLLAFMDKLGITRAHLMGLSMGAAVAEQFVLDHPERTHALVLLSAFERAEGGFRSKLLELRSALMSGGVPAFFDEAVKLVVTPEFRAAYAAAIEDSKKYCIQVNSASALINATGACLAFDIHGKVSQISTPALVLCGKEDVFISNELAWKVYHAIKGSKWLIMSGVGHNLITPENTSRLERVVLDFLSAQSVDNAGCI